MSAADPAPDTSPLRGVPELRPADDAPPEPPHPDHEVQDGALP